MTKALKIMTAQRQLRITVKPNNVPPHLTRKHMIQFFFADSQSLSICTVDN